ncbi:MAG: hypothetical protein ABIR94_05820 [Rubrivivax sp.]
MRKNRWGPIALALCSGLAAAAAAGAGAASAAATTATQARHDRERSACMVGKSAQDQATCLKEADAAWAEARKGQLNTGGAAPANAVERCKALPGPQRSECEARMRGEGSVSGSVAGGGILRELVTPVPASAASAGR